VADFEAVAGLTAAVPAWQAAVRRWPLDSHPHLALGNQAYARGDLAGSVTHYRRGLALDSENPALRNNLASVLGELGCARIGEAV
jgi:Flp pilus assembly protein TadD